MAKFVLTSDIHLGEYSYGFSDPETGLNTRLLDLYKAFLQSIDFAINKQVQYFIIAGDVYHVKHPKSHIRKLFAKAIRTLLINNIKVLIIPGNHDQTIGLGKSHAFSEMQELSQLFDNLKIFDKPEIVKLDEETQMAFIPFINRAQAQLLTKDIFYDWIIANIATLSNNIQGKHRYFISHFATDKSAMGGSTDVGTSDIKSLPIKIFEESRFTKVYLGDIHKHQQLSEKVFHIGSIAQTTFAEENEVKGFYYSNNGKEQFIKTNAPEFFTIYKDLTKDCRNDMQNLIDNIQEYDLQHLITRINVDINENDLSKISFDGLKDYMKEESYVFLDVYRNVIKSEKPQIKFDEMASSEILFKQMLEMNKTYDDEIYEMGCNILKKVGA